MKRDFSSKFHFSENINPIQCLLTHCKMLHGEENVINYIVQNTLSKEEPRLLFTEKKNYSLLLLINIGLRLTELTWYNKTKKDRAPKLHNGLKYEINKIASTLICIKRN